MTGPTRLAGMALKHVAAAMLLLVTASVAWAQVQPTFYEGFDKGKLAGPVGKAGNAVAIDPRGILNMDRGTIAFFFQSTEAPKTTEWNHIGPAVNTDYDSGYYAMGMSFCTRREDFLFNLFDIGAYARPIHLPTIFGRWQAGQWHHLAATWDRVQGVIVYEDGKQIASTWGKQQWRWSIMPVRMNGRGPIDEVYIYDVPLSAQQIAQLAAGEAPTGEPLPPAAADVIREDGMLRMGWVGESFSNLPRVSAGQAMQFTFARVAGCVDAKRPVAYPYQGLLRSPWPSLKYGASVRGRRLHITLDEGQRFDRVRVLAQRKFIGALKTADDQTELARFDVPEAMFWHAALPKPVQERQLLLRRRAGLLGQIDFYRAEPAKDQRPRQAVTYGMTRADAFPQTDTGKVLMTETPRHLWNPVQATRQSGAAWVLDAPAFGGFQAVCESPSDAQAYDSARVELVAQSLGGPTPVRVEIKEPVDAERVWLAADAVLVPKGSGAQRFVITLSGRPVANTPAYQHRKYLGNGKYADEVIDVPAQSFALKVEAGEPVQWVMGDKGTTLSVIPAADQAAALARAVEHQVEWMREAYAERMEGHAYGDRRLLLPLTWLALHAPQRMEFRQMWERVEHNKPNIVGREYPPLVMPEIRNDSGAPDWAFWQMQAVNRIRQHQHWMIDQKQVWTGEYGGIWNDDADHIENWIDDMLCLDGSGKIQRSMRRYWDGLWRYHLVDGVGKYTQDAGHYAEEGTMNLGMRLLVEYGDPVAYARTLLAAKRASNWVEPDPAGGYRWKSFWIGPTGAWTERDFYNPRKSGGHQADVVIQQGYLIWYNRHPAAADLFLGLEMKDFGFLGTARRIVDNWPATRDELAQELLKPLKARIDAGQMLAVNELGMNDQAKAVHRVEFSPAPDIAHYWGSHDTDIHWYRWKASGDDRFLVDSYKKVLQWFYSHDWLNGPAQPSLDRNPLPRGSVIRSRIGAFAANRGGSGNMWPMHAISFTRGTDDVASLVTENLDNQFATRLYAFTDQPLDLQLRVWRCNGLFDVSLKSDANDDGVGEQVLWQQQMELDRGAFVDLQLPPRQSVVLSAKPIKTAPIDFNKPDPAISVSSIEVPYGGHLVVHVYNNGLKPVDDVLVRVRDARSGEIVVSGERHTGPIAAPLDLQPQFATVEFKNIECEVWDDMIIEIDPDKQVDDFTRYNNRVRVRHDLTFDLHDWWHPGEYDGQGRTRPAAESGVADDARRDAD